MGEQSAAEAPASVAAPGTAPQSVAESGAAAAAAAAEEGTSKMAIVAVFVVLLILGVVGGLLLTGALGGAEEPNDGGSKTTTKATTNATSGMPSRTKFTGKAGMFVCVIGLHLTSSAPLKTDFCDYIIYPDLALPDREVVASYGGTSWGIFKAQAMEGFEESVKTGGSFLQSSPVGHLAAQIKPIGELLEAPLNFRALGYLDVRFASGALEPLKTSFEVFHELLKTKEDAMTFLGVIVPSQSLAGVLAEELQDFRYIDTIILQTHITPSTDNITYGNCMAHYVGYLLGEKAHDVPTLSIAKKTLIAIKKKRKDFRIMFSSTFGVMIYTSTQEIKAYNDRCEYAFLATVDALCPETGPGIVLKDDKKERAKYATWEKNGRHHFLSTMDGNDISAVMSDFIEDVSEGWAGFNIELEERNVCKVDEEFAHIERMSFLAKARRKG